MFWLAASQAFAQSASDRLKCTYEGSVDDRIAGCTALIDNMRLGSAARSEFLLTRAQLWRDKGDCDRAISDVTMAGDLTPAGDRMKRYLFLVNRGLLYSSCNGRYEEAIADYLAAVRIKPDESGVYSNLGLIYATTGDFDRSITNHSQAISRYRTYLASRKLNSTRIGREVQLRLENEQMANYYNARGLTFMRTQDYVRAHADFSEAIRLNRNGYQGWANRGNLFRLKGDFKASLADLEQASSVATKSALVKSYQVDAYRYLGELDKALSIADVAVSDAPDFVRAYVSRGLTHEKKGDFTKARADYAKALEFPEYFYDTNKEAQLTAQARVAAIDSGAPQPEFAAVSPKVPVSTKAVLPVVTKPAPVSGRRVALIIGNSAYKSVGSLANPQKDAEVIATSLRNIGFDKVELVSDASREALVNALRAFAEEAEKAEWAVVYYAGHGIEVNGINYLIPVDARLAADRDVQFETVPLDQVMASVEGARKLKVVILDACRDNPFAPQMRKTAAPEAVAQRTTAGGAVATRSIGRGLGEVKVSGATLVVYAAKHGQIALDGEGGNSPFAVALVQRVATPGVEINKIFRLIRDDVMEATAGRQEPFTYGSLPGREDFFFVTK